VISGLLFVAADKIFILKQLAETGEPLVRVQKVLLSDRYRLLGLRSFALAGQLNEVKLNAIGVVQSDSADAIGFYAGCYLRALGGSRGVAD